MSTYDVREFGAVGDGQTNDTQAIQKTIDTAGQTGGMVLIPTGRYVTGTIYLRSNVTICLWPGAVWQAADDPDLFPMIPAAVPSMMETEGWKAFLYADDVENLTLCGDGILECGGKHPCFQTGKGNDPNRPFGLHINRSRNVTVKDLTLRNSAFWMQRYYLCDHLRLAGLTVWNHSHLNNDGVDIDGCRNVVVSDCRIDASDDALCFKSEGTAPVENVTVTNCVLSSFASAFKLGTGSVGGFRRITATNCVVRPSDSQEMTHGCGCWNGLMGIDLGNVDGGVLEDVFVNNFVMDGCETPIYMKLGCRHAKGWRPPDGHMRADGRTRNVRIDNVIATGAGPIASALVGYDKHPIENVSLSRISVVASRTAPEPVSEEVEIHADQYPFNRIFNSPLPAYGLYVRHARRLALDDIELIPAEGEPRAAAGWFQNVDNLTARNLRSPILDEQDTFVFRDCTDVKRS